MKKFLLICLCILISLPAFGFSVREFLYPTYTTQNWASIVLDKLKWIYLIKPTRRELMFNSRGTSARALGQEHWTGAIIINAWYFWRDSAGYFPAGHFSLDPAIVDKSWCERDLNLCGYISTDSLHIQEHLTFTKEPTLAAWPVLMLDGKVNKDVQNKTSHRTQKRTRTVLIETKKWPVFLIAKKQYRLDWILAYSVKYFGRDISVINLDGGSSTSIRTDNSVFQFNATKTLPTFFILK